jgi:flagellar biosynthesis regulator FlaF
MDEDIRELFNKWDQVAYKQVVPALESGDYQAAEDAIASLIAIDIRVLRKMNELERTMGER